MAAPVLLSAVILVVYISITVYVYTGSASSLACKVCTSSCPLVNFITCIYTVIVEKYYNIINRVEHISLAHSDEAIEHMNMHLSLSLPS